MTDKTIKWYVVLLDMRGAIKDVPLLDHIIPCETPEEAMLRLQHEERQGELPILVSSLVFHLIHRKDT